MEVTKIISREDYNNSNKYQDIEDSGLDFNECYDLVKEYCLTNRVRISGVDYQLEGLPVIDDKYVFLVTQRAWGDLMAEVWSVVDGVRYRYVDWAWCVPD
jgi:hypothetical protein